jgi:hypothetical protein
MAPDREVRQQTFGMPDPASIIGEVTFTPKRQAPADAMAAAHGLTPAAAAAAPAAVTVYRVIRTTERDSYDPKVLPVPSAAPAEVAAVPERAAPPRDDYSGKSRKAAKLSIVNGPIEVFNDLQDLIKTFPPNPSMCQHEPPISDNASSNRVVEEEHNPRVRAFLYAASHESDNDYHLIVGRDPSLTPHNLMTMEISGLPMSNSASFTTLKAARDAFKEFFASNNLPLPGSEPGREDKYDFYNPPFPIEIQGSIFFDVHHCTGSHPGPASLKKYMHTLWEVHPVTDIVFNL